MKLTLIGWIYCPTFVGQFKGAIFVTYMPYLLQPPSPLQQPFRLMSEYKGQNLKKPVAKGTRPTQAHAPACWV
jgi:hypothetical protein